MKRVHTYCRVRCRMSVLICFIRHTTDRDLNTFIDDHATNDLKWYDTLCHLKWVRCVKRQIILFTWFCYKASLKWEAQFIGIFQFSCNYSRLHLIVDLRSIHGQLRILCCPVVSFTYLTPWFYPAICSSLRHHHHLRCCRAPPHRSSSSTSLSSSATAESVSTSSYSSSTPPPPSSSLLPPSPHHYYHQLYRYPLILLPLFLQNVQTKTTVWELHWAVLMTVTSIAMTANVSVPIGDEP